MFARRVKIFLTLLLVITGILLARSMQLQVMARSYWRERATEVMKRSQMIETTRGRIVDAKGRAIAVDQPCIDACVDYRAITPLPDPEWVKKFARRRLAERGASRQMLESEIRQVETDIKIMWARLEKLSGKSPDEFDDIRQSIVRKVEMRRRSVWYQRYEQARRGLEGKEPPPWYRRWLIDEMQDAPQLDQFEIPVAEQTDAHVILRAISPKVSNELGKNLGRFPGLELRPSTHRYYPYGQTACHLLGTLSRVTREDLQKDPSVGRDELRQYFPNDLIGRSGLESLCEPLLRGTRGRVERYVGDDEKIVQASEPAAGKNVRTTIDILLQSDIEELFKEVELKGPSRNPFHDKIAMPGAAVVIDVASGEVRAMVSCPTFDLNDYDVLYDQLAKDNLNRPLMNRATQFQLEPGSTVKPIVGLGAIAQGLLSVNETVECKGFLEIGGKRYSYGRCWVASNFAGDLGANVAHHPIPWDAPHPTGHLNLTDALERSCNIYFETVADRLQIEGLSYWFNRFGLGKRTGIGIAEVAGRVPGDAPINSNRRAAAWFAGIGQDQVLATPLQMANVAATLARNGVWMRPRIVSDEVELAKPPEEPESDRIDLGFSAASLAAVREGMIRVVNSPAGTGSQAHSENVLVAGKTGSAQASPLRYPQRDELGRIIKDENGRVNWIRLEPIGTHAAPNPQAPWYRGTPGKEDRLAHAWFIGYAPAEDPKIAFAVLVEYGGSGGAAAGSLAKRILDACIAHGYLSTSHLSTVR